MGNVNVKGKGTCKDLGMKCWLSGGDIHLCALLRRTSC